MGFVKINQTKLRSAATSLFDVGRWTLLSAGGGQVLARLWRVRCSVCLIFLILFTSAHYASAQTWFTVKWVNDGDTIILTNGKRVRYIGINAPEIDHDKQGAQPFGHAAKTFNKQMVLNRKIRLDFDLERQDRYGRLLYLRIFSYLTEHF
jgi:hypothetical protein